MYPDPTHRREGNTAEDFCHEEVKLPKLSFYPSEMKWTYEKLLIPLNKQIYATGRALPAPKSTIHGICTADR